MNFEGSSEECLENEVLQDFLRDCTLCSLGGTQIKMFQHVDSPMCRGVAPTKFFRLESAPRSISSETA